MTNFLSKLKIKEYFYLPPIFNNFFQKENKKVKVQVKL